MDPFFSRRQVQNYEAMILEEMQLLDGRLQGLRGSGTVVDMEHVYAAVAGDIIGRISVVNPPSFVLDPNFSPDW